MFFTVTDRTLKFVNKIITFCRVLVNLLAIVHNMSNKNFIYFVHAYIKPYVSYKYELV